jgi:peroxiredoxin
LRSFEEHLREFEARDVRVVAISVDPPEVSRELRRERGYTYTFLADTQGAAVRRYDLAHEGAGPGGQVIARPAEFLVDAGGTIRWVNLTGSVLARARPEQVLRVVDELARAGSLPGARAESVEAGSGR